MGRGGRDLVREVPDRCLRRRGGVILVEPLGTSLLGRLRHRDLRAGVLQDPEDLPGVRVVVEGGPVPADFLVVEVPPGPGPQVDAVGRECAALPGPHLEQAHASDGPSASALLLDGHPPEVGHAAVPRGRTSRALITSVGRGGAGEDCRPRCDESRGQGHDGQAGKAAPEEGKRGIPLESRPLRVVGRWTRRKVPAADVRARAGADAPSEYTGILGTRIPLSPAPMAPIRLASRNGYRPRPTALRARMEGAVKPGVRAMFVAPGPDHSGIG